MTPFPANSARPLLDPELAAPAPPADAAAAGDAVAADVDGGRGDSFLGVADAGAVGSAAVETCGLDSAVSAVCRGTALTGFGATRGCSVAPLRSGGKRGGATVEAGGAGGTGGLGCSGSMAFATGLSKGFCGSFSAFS